MQVHAFALVHLMLSFAHWVKEFNISGNRLSTGCQIKIYTAAATVTNDSRLLTSCARSPYTDSAARVYLHRKGKRRWEIHQTSWTLICLAHLFMDAWNGVLSWQLSNYPPEKSRLIAHNEIEIFSKSLELTSLSDACFSPKWDPRDW